MTTGHSFMAGGSEMGARIRALDWSQTPLGPVEHWPQSLRSALSILLPSKAQIALCWGKQFITLYNDAYRPVFGAKHPRVLGKPISEAWDELWRAGLKELFEGVVSTGEAFWARDRPFFMERHGYLEETYFDVSYDPVRDESGEVGGLFCIVSETTGRVVGERRLRTLRDLAKAIQELRTVDAVYRAAAQALAASAAEDIPFALFYGADASGVTEQLVATAGLELPHPAAPASPPDAEGLDWPLAAELLVVDRWVGGAVHAGPWPEAVREVAVLRLAGAEPGGPRGHLVAGINPRRRVDDDYRDFLRLIAASISSAIAGAHKSEEEHRRAESLAELDRAKTAFFTNISHEFRTPLTLLLGPIEEALKSGSLAGDELLLAHRSGRRLLRLVNGLLDFARIQAGRLKARFVAVDLPRFTHDLVSVFQSAADRAGLTLTVETDPLDGPVHVDVDMYEKIVANLLSNAIKFTPTGAISVALRDRGGSVELAVSDTGIGVSEGELPRLFERFHRIEGAWSRTQEGSGIGLALLRDLVLLHGGQVEARSVLGQGTTIVVELPKAAPATTSDADASPLQREPLGGHGAALAEEAAGWSRGEEGEAFSVQTGFSELERAEASTARLLIVDDNADMRDYLTRLLGRRWQVSAVTDGAAALEAIAQSAPDLVVSDVMMPGVDGFGLISALRSAPNTRSIPVILVSARAGEEARIEALRAGADDYVVKPFSARELGARVESQLLRVELRTIERQQAERLAEVFEHAPVGIALLRGAQHRYEFVNDAYLELIDRRPVLGLPIRKALPELADQGIYELLDRVYASGRPFHARSMRLVLDDVDGTPRERFFDFVYQPMLGPDERATGIAVVVYDVSALTAARREADRANRVKDEFLAMLGHELRNPLAPIVTVLHVMRKSASQAFAPERAILERQVDHLVRLVDDLLDVSRIASGKVELRQARFDLRDSVDTSLEAASPELERRRHRVRCDIDSEPLWVNGDAARLAQVISNLLVNAAKYTPPGGSIEVIARRDGDRIELLVIDDGIGISAEMLPRVFDLFMQERQAVDRAGGGLGLGLAIVKSLVHAHGGEVFASSQGEGKGSEFRIVLPRDDTQDGTPEPDATPPAQTTAGGYRVLVVDDNIDAAESLAHALELHGHEVRVSPDGPRALDIAASFRPQIAILDIGLPVMDGYQLAGHLKAAHAGIRLIALTGYGERGEREASEGTAFEIRLLKPVDLPALVAQLASAWPARQS